VKKRAGFIVLCLLALAAAWFGHRVLRARPAPAREVGRAPETAAPQRRRVARRSPPRSPPRAADEAAGCEPDAVVRCHRGDVWSFDSCGEAQEKLEECENRACRVDTCDEPPSEPCDEPGEGRCDGDRVRLCQAGRAITLDCRSKGLRCVYGDEGAECAPEVPSELRCSGARLRCDGDVLVGCEQQRTTRTDCRALGAKCLQLAGAPRCVALQPINLGRPDCGPCGCVPEPGSAERVCDGRDDDGDGLVDEGLDCGPVPVIAFIVTDATGESSHGPEDVNTELAEATRLFTRESREASLAFKLQELIYLSDPALLDLDDRDIGRLANDPRLHPVRDQFYVPVVFTDRILAAGDVPKLGISTLPNATCGGVQLGQGPDVGLVAVAKARSPTTVAHELGHFLGLCHTHGNEQSNAPVAVQASSDPLRGVVTACRASCRDEGDGVCDTPLDPGPPHCAYDLTCNAACESGAVPDATNLMSYYTECRNHFSDEQAALMQHTLALRRGWQRCFEAGCPCALGTDDCPAGMSCKPVVINGTEHTGRCGLDGPRPPGADCKQVSDCGRGSICVKDARRGMHRCARPCSSSSENCECVAAGSDVNVCLQDLGS
jgi:hypothetical protein